MPKGQKTANYEKKKIAAEICDQLGIPSRGASHFKDNAGNFIAEYFDTVLKRIARRTGVPPSYLPERERRIWRLLHKGTESLLLALEIVNRPTIHYRLETFLNLYAAAWEAIMKARITRREAEEPDLLDGFVEEEVESLGFARLLARCFPDGDDPVRRNLARLAELRDEAPRHYVDAIPPILTFLFQAGVRQFERSLKEWHGLDLSDAIPIGMLFIAADFDPAQFDLRDPALRRRYAEEDLAWLGRWHERLEADARELPDEDLARFLLPIDLRMQFAKSPNGAEIKALLAAGSSVVVKREFNPDVTHTMTTGNVRDRVNAELGTSLSSNDVVILVKIHRIKERKEMCWVSHVNNGRPQYSQAFLDWLKGNLAADPGFLPRARRAYQETVSRKGSGARA